MKLTLKEVASLEKIQERIDAMKAALVERAHNKMDTNDIEANPVINGLNCASAGIEQAIEQYYLLINNI